MEINNNVQYDQSQIEKLRELGYDVEIIEKDGKYGFIAKNK